MSQLDDIPLERSPDPGTPVPSQSRWGPALVAVVLVCALLAAWYYWRSERSPEEADRVGVKQDVVPAAPAPAVEVPPLDQSDAFVRDLVRALSSHPVIASWLTSDQLIRNFAVSVRNVAEGDTPARHLKTIAPARSFQVRRERGAIYIDETSYARFDGHAAAVSGLDPKQTAELYRLLKPRIEEAYREVAGPGADFERDLRVALTSVLDTPVVDRPIELTTRVAGYDYADPSLQSLSPSQQQLLRMGPNNARRIQQSLRAIASELGIMTGS
jgi:Protein of unknown function (DUF3014)